MLSKYEDKTKCMSALIQVSTYMHEFNLYFYIILVYYSNSIVLYRIL